MENENLIPPLPPSKADAIKAITQTLKERRHLRNMTLEKASAVLKIRLVYLKALEEGNWSELPGEVYVRGFLSRYSQFLGLKSEELLAPYFQSMNGVPKSASKTSFPLDSDFSRPLWIGGVLGVILIISFIKLVQTHRVVSPQPTTTQTSQPVQTPTLKPAINKVPDQQHTLRLSSPLPLWVSVKTEKKNFEGFIPQQSTWSWSGEGNFSIRLGHTQQVVLIFDDRQIILGENQKRVFLPNEN